MKKEKEIKVEGIMSDQKILIINGQKYILDRVTSKKIDGVKHGDKVIYKKFNEEQYTNDLKIVIDAIKDKVTKEHLLNELLKTIDAKTLRRLVRRIKTKKPIKRQDGCLGFKFGNDAYLQLIE